MISLGLWRSRTRLLLASAALAGLVGLTGCQTDGVDMAKAMKPLSAETVSLIESKGMDKHSPILVRVFKEEAELEVWKQNRDGEYALLKTYPICRWSGELGPKIKQGDRQAPEGFYTITPAQMNPRSQYYLSFNLGYPNAFDRAHGRTGSHLMVHGDCSSAGCYSMTDEQIQEIYSLGREAFFGGQKTFQVQAYPFRMTALNMARHRNSPHLAFWKMLKEGNDHFEVARAEPKVDVCERRYVFNAQEPAGSTRPMRFDPTARCPDFEVAPEVASQVATKTKRDELAFSDYVRRGTATVPVTLGQDGGMHPTFLAALNPQQLRDQKGNVRWAVDSPPIGTKIRPVAVASADDRFNASAAPADVVAAAPANVPMPRSAPRRSRAFASADTTHSTSAAYSSPVTSQAGAVFDGIVGASNRAASSVARVFGFGRNEEPPKPTAQPAPARRSAPVRTAAKPQPAAEQPETEKPAARTAEAAPPLRRSVEASPSTTGSTNLLSGSAPVLPTGGFENRWPGTLR